MLARLSLRLLSFQRVRSLFDRASSRPRFRGCPPETIRWALLAAAHRLPGTRCLPRALVLQALLREAGLDARPADRRDPGRGRRVDGARVGGVRGPAGPGARGPGRVYGVADPSSHGSTGLLGMTRGRTDGDRLVTGRTPEGELLLCLARAVLPAAVRERAGGLIRAGCAGTVVREAAQSHGLTLLLHRHLASAFADLCPPGLVDALSARDARHPRREPGARRRADGPRSRARGGRVPAGGGQGPGARARRVRRSLGATVRGPGHRRGSRRRATGLGPAGGAWPRLRDGATPSTRAGARPCCAPCTSSCSSGRTRRCTWTCTGSCRRPATATSFLSTRCGRAS